MMKNITDIPSNLRHIPSVERVLNTPEMKELMDSLPRWLVLKNIRDGLEDMRASVIGSDSPVTQEEALDRIVLLVKEKIASIQKPSIKRVINGTGVIIHTNLGRAPLPPEAIAHIKEVAEGYSNLEYVLESGKRGKRTEHVREILRRLTGAYDAFVVNNNAGAVFLALNSLAEGKEVIVSRGELVEIGGSFRIPEVMRKSGAIMKEVGTTNRTHPADYEQAITENTSLLLKVHTSNYRIMGFSSEVSLKELVEIGRKHNIPVMADLGSGNLTDLSAYGLKGEPTIHEILSTGVQVVTFSGDKLLGGPQAGVILTQEGLNMVRITTNPLARALRIDKLTLAALESTLLIYQKRDCISSIPVLRMISMNQEEIRSRAQDCLSQLEMVNNGGMRLGIEEGVSTIGGGSLPTETLPTFVLSFSPGRISLEEMEEAFHKATPPVIGRIQEGKFIIDFRTIMEDELPLIVQIYRGIVASFIGRKK